MENRGELRHACFQSFVIIHKDPESVWTCEALWIEVRTQEVSWTVLYPGW